jgi:hypothetical protein
MTSNLFKAILPCLALLTMSCTLVAQDYNPLIEWGDGEYFSYHAYSGGAEVSDSGTCSTSQPVLADATETWSCPTSIAEPDAVLQSGVEYCTYPDIGEYECGVYAQAQVTGNGLLYDNESSDQYCGYDQYATGGPNEWQSCGQGMATVGVLSTKQLLDFALLEKRIFTSSEPRRTSSARASLSAAAVGAPGPGSQTSESTNTKELATSSVPSPQPACVSTPADATTAPSRYR